MSLVAVVSATDGVGVGVLSRDSTGVVEADGDALPSVVFVPFVGVVAFAAVDVAFFAGLIVGLGFGVGTGTCRHTHM